MSIAKAGILTAVSLFCTVLVLGQSTEHVQLVHYRIEQIDSTEYRNLKQKLNPEIKGMKAVTDLRERNALIGDIASWGEYKDGDVRENALGDCLLSIDFRNGEKFVADDHDDYYGFIAYYPEEDVLLLEGGHSSDISFNLTTGEEREYAGNPEYIIYSPARKHRLNGYFGGQECSYYFIQQKYNERYVNVIQLDDAFDQATGLWLCIMGDAFWADDDTFYFITLQPSIDNTRAYDNLYYRLLLSYLDVD